jgi:two-component system sensor histidine kinase ChiS
VNTAARIESLSKYYKSPLLLSQDTHGNLADPGQFHFRHLGSVRLKGKHKLLSILECLDGLNPDQRERKLKTLPVFIEAMSLYHEQRFENASRLFERIMSTDPTDLTAGHFHDNARKYLQNGVPENWTGAEEMIKK